MRQPGLRDLFVALLLALACVLAPGCGDIAPLPSPSSEPEPILGGGGPPGENGATGVGNFDDMTPAAVPMDGDAEPSGDADASGSDDATDVPDAAQD